MSLGLRGASPGVGTRLRDRIVASSFRQRLALLSAAAVAVAVVLASAITFVIVRSELRGEVDQSLKDTVNRISVPAELLLPGTVSRGQNVLVLPQGQLGSRDVYAQVVRPNGSVVRPRGSRIRLPIDERVLEVAPDERGAFFTDATIGGRPRAHLHGAGAHRRRRAGGASAGGGGPHAARPDVRAGARGPRRRCAGRLARACWWRAPR